MKRQYIKPNTETMQAGAAGIIAASAMHDSYTDAEQLVKGCNDEDWSDLWDENE